MPELSVSDDRDGFLKNVVAELMSHEALYDKVDAHGLNARLVRSKLTLQRLIVPDVRALEDHINLMGSLGSLKALLDDVRRELQLAEPDEVTCNEVQNLIISHIILELQHILDQVVAERILNEHVNTTDDDISEGELLGFEALLKASLHHATSVLIRANLIAVSHASVKDKLRVHGKVL